ncbi:hypothetical protein FRB96_003731 [Tulasnella sp. 330]|nr:hypothetical protein FRB96_003731 [Tulasnella sp. 330]KAG8874947.1 hypothetical protein FRB97_005523 [Tulasnella sp. 331]KAG8882169.1 hypothetical protein FRB98_003891 [Tulasnella sp. 332]
MASWTTSKGTALFYPDLATYLLSEEEIFEDLGIVPGASTSTERPIESGVRPSTTGLTSLSDVARFVADETLHTVFNYYGMFAFSISKESYLETVGLLETKIQKRQE